MKGEQAEYMIPLRTAFRFPKPKRMIKTLGVIRQFVFKHTRKKDVLIANEVNEYLHKNSKNVPRRVDSVIVIDGEKAMVFLREGKGLEEFRKRQAEKKKGKEKKGEKAKETPKDSDEQKELKRKKEEKKLKEDSARKADIKRKTGTK